MDRIFPANVIRQTLDILLIISQMRWTRRCSPFRPALLERDRPLLHHDEPAAVPLVGNQAMIGIE